MNLLEHFVGGKLISGTSDKKSKVFNPATGEQESEVRLANKTDLDKVLYQSDDCLIILYIQCYR